MNFIHCRAIISVVLSKSYSKVKHHAKLNNKFDDNNYGVNKSYYTLSSGTDVFIKLWFIAFNY